MSAGQPLQSSMERDRALRLRRTLTATIAAAGVGGVITFGALAAFSNAGQAAATSAQQSNGTDAGAADPYGAQDPGQLSLGGARGLRPHAQPPRMGPAGSGQAVSGGS